MRNLNRQEAQPALFRGAAILLMGLAAMTAAGCSGERDSGDGRVINTIVLPTDLVLNLACADVGIASESCVLEDPENPYIGVPIIEFNVNNPGAENKFDLFNGIPPGPTGAKARFYFFATALARTQSGENQWYTARALHEVYTYSGDDLIRLQALKAYRSNLENFFGSVTYFNVFGFDIPGTLNEQVACDIYRPPAGLAELVLNEEGLPGNDLDKLELIGSWGFVFKPGPNPDNPCANSVVTVAGF